MPRRARFTIENGIYHILSRGNNRQVIFHDEKDFKQFLSLVKYYKRRYGLKIYHYKLMSNHFHAIIESETGKKLSDALKSIKLLYAQYYRKKYGGTGHLWEERFKNFIIESGRYLLECGRYIELNAVRAGMVSKPEDYKWSSYTVYALGKNDGITDLSPEYLGLGDTAEQRRRLYRDFVASGHKEKRQFERFFRVGAYGSEQFVEAMKVSGLKSLWSHKGRPKKKSAAAK